MISYSIVALHFYKQLFKQIYKSQFQIIFDQDSFPLKLSLFQVCLQMVAFEYFQCDLIFDISE